MSTKSCYDTGSSPVKAIYKISGGIYIMYVKFNLGTGYIGEDCEIIYHFEENLSEEEIRTYGLELASEHAEMYGHYTGEDDSGVEYEPEMSYEILEGMSVEEIEEEYGEILEA